MVINLKRVDVLYFFLNPVFKDCKKEYCFNKMDALARVSSLSESEQAQNHVSQECKSTYRCNELQLFGKRCAKVIFLFYNPANKLFYEATPANINRAISGGNQTPIGPFMFIQNSKLGFYIEQQASSASTRGGNGDSTAIIEYFRDSYEGWYINKYVHGHSQSMTNSESAKFCQCRWALNMNTASFQQAIVAGKSVS